MHFLFGMLLSCFGFLYVYLFALGFIATLLKEVYDYVTDKGEPELADTLFTFAGAFVPLIIYFIFFN